MYDGWKGELAYILVVAVAMVIVGYVLIVFLLPALFPSLPL